MLRRSCSSLFFCFFFNDTATTEIYTLSLHDALPILRAAVGAYDAAAGRTTLHAGSGGVVRQKRELAWILGVEEDTVRRSEEHTSELQSLAYLVCRLLLEKKKTHSTSSSIA